MIEAVEALKRLKDGNKRFVSGMRSYEASLSSLRREELTSGQQPFAIILGCSDSRVPAEIVFDQGLGDLFVIRIAGNIANPSQIGSIEFAATRFDTRLVVVLGHSNCGAVMATVEELKNPTELQSRNLKAIIEGIRPSVEPLLKTDLSNDLNALVRKAVRANVDQSLKQLRKGSEILEERISSGKLALVGAEYSLEAGTVDFWGE